MSDEAYVAQGLDETEQKARAAIGEIGRRALPSESALLAAQRCESETRAAADKLTDQLQQVYSERDELKAKRDKLSIWRRSERAALEARIAEIEKTEDRLTASRQIATQRFEKALAGLAGAEKIHAIELAVARQAAAADMVHQNQILAYVRNARQILAIRPDFAHLGPKACRRLGQRIERVRGGLRNPNAKNIWGIPLDWGL